MSYSLVMLLLLTSIISAIPSSIILVKAAGDYPSYEHCAAIPSSIILVKEAGDYPSYEHCAPYTCGNFTIQYPFGTCGLLEARCEANQTILSTQSNMEHPITENWRVVGDITKSSYFTQTLQITPFDIYSNFDFDLLLKAGFFNLSQAYRVGTIVNCTQQPTDILVNNPKKLDCTESNTYCFFYPQAGFQIPSCDNYPLIVPTNKSYNISADKDFEQLQQTGFQVTWSDDDCHSCEASGGRCYSEFFSDSFEDYNKNYDTYCKNYDTYCICPNGSVIQYGKRVQYGERKRLSAKDMAAIFFALCAVFSIVVVSCIMVRRQSCCCQRSSTEQQQSIRAFMEPVDSRHPSVESHDPSIPCFGKEY